MVSTPAGRQATPEGPRPGAWREMRDVTAAKATGAANARRLARRVRNDRLVDLWSLAHVGWAAGLAMVVGPWWSLAIMVAWEPFEILLLGPLLSRKGIAFGHETWRNAASDIVFDAASAAAAYAVLLFIWDPLGVL